MARTPCAKDAMPDLLDIPWKEDHARVAPDQPDAAWQRANRP
jgi:hypothetical protein